LSQKSIHQQSRHKKHNDRGCENLLKKDIARSHWHEILAFFNGSMTLLTSEGLTAAPIHIHTGRKDSRSSN
jgi:hypothetical protein